MSILSRCRCLLWAAAVMAVSVSCADGPATPSSPEPSPAELIRFEIVAPQEIAPREAVELRVHAFRADGSLENVTSQATWSVRWASPLAVPSQPVVTVAPHGLATGGERGRAQVSVRVVAT